MGEHCLSKTCKNYPRVAFRINDVIERGLQMSCSVDAELALLNEDKMEFEKLVETINSNDISVNSIDVEDLNQIKIYDKMRTLIIEILQKRKISLNERIFAVGNFLNQIVTNHNFPNVQGKEVLSLINETRYYINKAEYTSKFASSHAQYKEQFNILNTILSLKFNESEGIGFTSKRYIECLWHVLDAFENIEDEDIADYYKENYETYLKPYLEKKEYILENFLVNYVFIYRDELFQLNKIWDFYIKLCVVYGLIKFNLIGLAIYHKGMDDELALKLIQSLTKTIIPDYHYLNSAVDYIKEIKIAELSKLNILIMN